jgi:hypothetical protein
MTKTVGELIKELEQFPKDKVVVYRKSEGDGYTSDWDLSAPFVGPDGNVALCAFARNEDHAAVMADLDKASRGY